MKNMFLFISHKLNTEQINDATTNFKIDNFIYLPDSLQQNKPEIKLNIELDYNKNTNLFDTKAQEVANKVSGTKTTQMRNFYDYVLDLLSKANKVDEVEFKAEILPFVKMLNSKVAYANSRNKLASDEFKVMINECVNQVKTKKDLETFKLFFEAVLGFSKK